MPVDPNSNRNVPVGHNTAIVELTPLCGREQLAQRRRERRLLERSTPMHSMSQHLDPSLDLESFREKLLRAPLLTCSTAPLIPSELMEELYGFTLDEKPAPSATSTTKEDIRLFCPIKPQKPLTQPLQNKTQPYRVPGLLFSSQAQSPFTTESMLSQDITPCSDLTPQ